MTIYDVHSLIVIAIVLLLVAGFAVLMWGRKVPRNGDWGIWSALAILLGALGMKAMALYQQGALLHVWSRGWVSAPNEPGAITVGVLEDPLALAMSAAALVLGVAVLLNRGLLGKEPRTERIHAAVAFACGGVAISAIALTPWLAIMGFAAIALAGFVAMGSRWNEDAEAALAGSFALQKTWGVLLALLGASGLAVSRAGLSWAESAVWFTGDDLSGVDRAGVALLLLGIYFQAQPFPFLSWLVRPTLAPTFHRVTLTQLFPILAAALVLTRVQPHLQATGILSFFGWLEIASAVLAMACGFAQSQWKLGLGSWLSAGSSLAMAMICFGQPTSGLAVILGLVFGGAAIADAASNLGAGNPKEVSDAAVLRGTWSRVLGLIGMLGATGALGFVSAGGMFGWILGAWNQPALAAIYVLALFSFALLGWRLAWQLFRLRNPVQFTWVSVLSPLLLIFFTFGWITSGSISGGVLPDGVDQVLPSLISMFAPAAATTDESAFVGAAIAYWLTLLVSIGLGYWLAERSRASKATEQSASFRRFVASGYGTDRFAHGFANGMIWTGAELVEFIDRRLWNRWLPKVLGVSIRKISLGAMALDTAIFAGIRVSLRKGIEMPARALQLLQNGDVQWYVFFGIGSGLLMLVYFMRN